MADISPFYGVRYNPAKIGSLAAVLSPPYDVITAEEQQQLYARSEYNIIRLEQGLSSAGDTLQHNKYTRAAATLRQWLEQEVLQPEPTPAFYLHDHHFEHRGKSLRQRGLIACVRLEEWNKGFIHPHETTLSRARSDRLELLRACKANLSPIWALYEDGEQRTAALLEAQTEQQPEIDLFTSKGERHILWVITEPETIQQIKAHFAQRPLYIADGHHRYETALAYQQEKQAAGGNTTSDKAFDWAMMSLVDFTDPGLVVLPVHRLVRGISPEVMKNLQQKMGQHFDLHPLPLDQADLSANREPLDLLDLIADRKSPETKMGVMGLEDGKFFLLTWNKTPAKAVDSHHSKPSSKLAAGVFHHVVMEEILGGSGTGEEGITVDYTYDAFQAIRQVLSGEYQLAFLLETVPAPMIKAVGDAGDRMPGKTTYFYPKMPAGLVLHPLED